MKIGTIEISKLYIGSTEVTKAYMGTDVVYTSGTEYQEGYTAGYNDFINETTTTNPYTSGTTAYTKWSDGYTDGYNSYVPANQRIHINNTNAIFKTNYVPHYTSTTDSVIECKMTINNESSDDGVGFMNMSQGDPNGDWFDGLTSFLTGNNKFNICCGSKSGEYYSYTNGANAQPVVIKLSNGEFQWDNTTETFATQSLSSSKVIRVGSIFKKSWTGDIYYIKAYENGVLVRDYEPTTENNVPVLKCTITSDVCTLSSGSTSALSIVTD